MNENGRIFDRSNFETKMTVTSHVFSNGNNEHTNVAVHQEKISHSSHTIVILVIDSIRSRRPIADA